MKGLHFRGLRGTLQRRLIVEPQFGDSVDLDIRRLDVGAGTGRDAAGHWDYYLAYNLFRMAAILHGIAQRAAASRAGRNAIARPATQDSMAATSITRVSI